MINKKVIILSITSDIGKEMALRWQDAGCEISGTYRKKEDNYNELSLASVNMCYANMLEKSSINDAINYFRKKCNPWDVAVLCPASQDPIGRFDKVDFDEWEESILLNFTSQLRFLHGILPFRNKKVTPTVILFAGGGTNNATFNYSAYTVSKVASIKMTELLDAEIGDVKFIIYGPGWVKTKIHQSTLNNRDMSGENYEKTVNKLNSNECTDMNEIINSIEWGINKGKETVGGRNFSVVFDSWGGQELEQELNNDENMYKLRRYKNDF